MESFKESLERRIKEIQDKFPSSRILLIEIMEAYNTDGAHIDYKEERTIMYYNAIEKFANSILPSTPSIQQATAKPVEQSKKLKKLIEKWKADVFAYETKAKNFGYNYSMYLSFKVRASLLKSCISEAEQLLQETGEGREEAIAVLYNHYKVNCPDEMTFDEFVKMKNGDDDVAHLIRATLDAMEEYKLSAPAPEITNEMKPVYNNAELKLKILLDNGIEFDRIGYSVKAVEENSLLAAMEEYRQQSSFGYSYEDMMDIAGWMAAADNKRPIHELKEEAENYIKTKKEYSQQRQGVDGWISVEDRLPECSEKFYESDHVLCYCISGQFVGWYNSKLNEWYVSHFLAATVPLSYDSIPTHWQPLPLPPTPPNIKNK